MKENHPVVKEFALTEELDTAVRLIRLGFGELQNLSLVNGFYFLPFQLLSQGFERLMKAYICIGFLCETKQYPSVDILKSHNLEKLLDMILTRFYSVDNRPILVEDAGFLYSNSDLKELLHILSEFGCRSRYYNFDVVTDNVKPGVDTKELWDAFESKIIKQEKLTHKLFDVELQAELYGDLARYIIVVFERFVSALSRQFIMGAIKSEGNQRSSYVFDFSQLYPEDFGKTNYRQATTRYKSTPKNVHRRTWRDAFQRRFNPRYKWVKIRQSEYNGEWPFLCEEITIECREGNWVVVTINGCDYALNGAARGRYKLETPHEAGMAVIGRSVGDFIQLALQLEKS